MRFPNATQTRPTVANLASFNRAYGKAIAAHDPWALEEARGDVVWLYSNLECIRSREFGNRDCEREEALWLMDMLDALYTRIDKKQG